MAPREAGTPSRTLLLRDLAHRTTEDDLRAFFARVAPAGFRSARLRKDRAQTTIGFAYYASVDDADAALRVARSHKLCGKVPSIFFARSTTAAPTNGGSHTTNGASSAKRARGPEGDDDDDGAGYGKAARRDQRLSSFSSSAPYAATPLAPRRLKETNHPPPQQHGTLDWGGPHQGGSVTHHHGGGVAPASRTLYVDGVPADMAVRELGHVFRPFPGFDSIRLKDGPRGPFAFVEFDSPAEALVALRAANG